MPVETPSPAESNQELSQPFCQSANRLQFVSIACYDAAGLIAALVFFAVMKRRLIGTRALRFAVATAVGAALGAALVAWDPLRADDVARCMHSAEYARFVMLATAGAVRAVLLGLVPAAVLAWLGSALLNRAY
jgi:hypothetical protein